MEKIEIYKEELELAALLGRLETYRVLIGRFDERADEFLEKRADKLEESIESIEQKIEQYELDK
jgi:hypothetical protein